MDYMIGQRIKERRKALNITQTQIQEKTSISSGNLSCIENGKYLPSATALIELSEILDCSVDWILTGNSSISNTNNVSHIEENELEKKLLKQFRALPKDDQEELITILDLKYNRVLNLKELEKSSITFTHTKNIKNEIA